MHDTATDNGDHIENVGDRTIEVDKAQPMERAAGVPDLGRLAQRMTRDVVDAFAAAGAAKARAVWSADSELDARYAEAFRDLLAYLVFEGEVERKIHLREGEQLRGGNQCTRRISQPGSTATRSVWTGGGRGKGAH